jgi:DNA repair exonuclease SbcCD ATPase subunit
MDQQTSERLEKIKKRVLQSMSQEQLKEIKRNRSELERRLSRPTNLQVLKKIEDELGELKKTLLSAKDRPSRKAIWDQRAIVFRKYVRQLMEWPEDASIERLSRPGLFEIAPAVYKSMKDFVAFTVTGTTSKKGKPIAEEWMRSRGVDWDGSIQRLREEVFTATVFSESVPDFGLKITFADESFTKPNI